jgi:hypothetical protein
MALDVLNSLNFAKQAPAGMPAGMYKNPNPTNHMPRATGGAFILPSVADTSPRPPHLIRTRNDKRQIAKKYGLDHCDRAFPAWCTNKLPDCGTRADRSMRGRTLDGRLGPALDDGRSSENRLAERATNSGERANAGGSATAMTFPVACLPPIMGASIAT